MPLDLNLSNPDVLKNVNVRINILLSAGFTFRGTVLYLGCKLVTVR